MAGTALELGGHRLHPQTVPKTKVTKQIQPTNQSRYQSRLHPCLLPCILARMLAGLLACWPVINETAKTFAWEKGDHGVICLDACQIWPCAPLFLGKSWLVPHLQPGVLSICHSVHDVCGALIEGDFRRVCGCDEVLPIALAWSTRRVHGARFPRTLDSSWQHGSPMDDEGRR